MTELICSKCKLPKDEEEFHWRNKSKGIRQFHCKECHLKFVKKHYDDNKQSYLDRSEKRRKEQQVWYHNLKDQLCCEICGEEERVCLDFHHIDPEKKDFEIGSNFFKLGKKTILKEIEKCICVCANCHRKIHKYGLDTIVENMAR